MSDDRAAKPSTPRKAWTERTASTESTASTGSTASTARKPSPPAKPSGPRRRAIPEDVVHPPVLYRATMSTVDCPAPARAVLTLLRSELEIATGRRLALGEVVARCVEFADARRDEFFVLADD